MNRNRSFLLAAFLAFAVVAFALPLEQTCADVIRLRTGETIKGRPRADRSDENVLVIEDYLSGAVRTLFWSVVDPQDRDRLHEQWEWKNKSMQAVKGHRLVQRLQGGATEDVRGLIVRETSSHHVVLRGGKEIQVPKAQVVEVVDEEMDPRDIWSPEQLVKNFLQELEKAGTNLGALTTREHWRIAEFAENAGDFETAKRHYQACVDDTEFLRNAVAKQRLERVEEILRDAAALDKLRDIRLALSLKSFRRARTLLEAFPEDHANAGPLIQRRLEKTKTDFKRRRDDYFQLEAKINFPKIILKEIKKKVAEKDIGYSDVKAFARRDLPEEAFKKLSERMNKRDDVTPGDARTFWDARRKSGWKTATYGAGTFIIDKPKIKPPKRKRNNKKRRSGGGAAPSFEIPKPPNQDGWWAKAGSKERVHHIMAWFVQNTDYFEVKDKFKYSLCPICNGAGLESKSLSNGETMSYLCTRCGGAQRDKRVEYR